MSQTDRQTDKAIWWSSGIFNVDGAWEKLEKPPAFVKEVKFQEEICPTTGNPHKQVAVQCHRQVRLSQMREWIQTHWKPVVGKQYIENLIKYVSKTETAVPGTQATIKGETYYRIHELLVVVAKSVINSVPTVNGKDLTDHTLYEDLTADLVYTNLEWANKLANPALKRMWEMWKYSFISRVAEWSEETGGAFIIEGTPEEDPTDNSSYLFVD